MYRRNEDPQSLDAIYDLRVGYGGNQGPLSNIDEGGFGAMAFHSYPDTLRWDAYSGDYGPNFLGHVIGAATYLVNHPTFGWVSFGGNVGIGKNLIKVEPRDAVRKKIFLAQLGLWVEFDAGEIEDFTFNTKSNEVSIRINGMSDESIMKWNQTATVFNVKMKLATDGSGQRYGGTAIKLPATVRFVAA